MFDRTKRSADVQTGGRSFDGAAGHIAQRVLAAGAGGENGSDDEFEKFDQSWRGTSSRIYSGVLMGGSVLLAQASARSKWGKSIFIPYLLL
ncbi:MAG: hypothetical protein P1U77_25445 [Rubripirellula sp.]|nr:hypothetical protein [Rubripirellula sp.]